MDIRYKNIRHHAYEIRIVVTGYLIDDVSAITAYKKINLTKVIKHGDPV